MSPMTVSTPAPFALARSCAEAIAVFDTADQLARAIVRRCGDRPHRVIKNCWCTARDPHGEPALSVYAVSASGVRIAFIGYAFGLRHDGVALRDLLRGVATVMAEAA